MKCEYKNCNKTATMECGTMGMDLKLKMIKLCDSCVKKMAIGKCVIDGRD